MNIIIKIKAIIWNIFELDIQKSQKASRFDYLDGYRGSLAVIVAVSHIINKMTCEIFNATIAYSQTYSVAGFFMLSAFLLTYRLFEDLKSTNNHPRLILLLVIKYFIRRFFRIYAVYFIFIVAVKFGPKCIGDHEMLTYESSFLQMVTLGNAGKNHLWTIPAEIRYYLFILIFCLIVNLFRKCQWICLIICLTWTIYDQLFNFFDLTIDQLKFDYEGIHYLYPHFAVFFMGSQVALAYHLINKSDYVMSLLKNYYVQVSLDFISLFIAIIGLKNNWWILYDRSDFAYRSRPTLYWSSALLLTLLSAPNTISNFFGSSRVLKSIGKYSFSFYLLHMGVGTWLRKFNFEDQLGLVSCGLAISYIISFFVFYLVENQLIRLANCLCSKVDNHCFFKSDRNQNKLNSRDSFYVKLIS